MLPLASQYRSAGYEPGKGPEPSDADDFVDAFSSMETNSELEPYASMLGASGRGGRCRGSLILLG